MYKLLVVDASPSSRAMMSHFLMQEGYAVIEADSADSMFIQLNQSQPDLFLIDIDSESISREILCYRLRNDYHFNETPILFLSHHNKAIDVADALESGGDDYIRKPFALKELGARIRAHLRRAADFNQPNLVQISIIPESHQVFINGDEVPLTRMEFDLLRYMCSRPSKWHTTRDLLANVWKYPQGIGDSALVRNHIRNLRRKVEDNPERPAIIQSRHGRGYVVKANIRFES
ncbi:response regulator transcription factor [Anaerolineales bacterium]